MVDLRPDGTPKGPGFLGNLETPSGNISTELSIGVGIEGEEMLIPSLVPTLTLDEIDHLLEGNKPTKEIVDKAVEHAIQRRAEGKSVFAEGETMAEYSFTPTKKSEPYLGAVSKAEETYGLPKNMLANLLHTESSFDPKAVGPMTRHGKAKGIAQIISKFHPGVNPYDTEQAIDYTGKKLREYYDEFGDWDSAIASWNAGPTNVRNLGLEGIKKSKQFKETQNYLKNINASKIIEEKTAVETDRFGGIVEPQQTTDRFGGIIDETEGDEILPAEPGPEAVGPTGLQYSPEQLERYGTITAGPPTGQRFLEDYARPITQAVGAGAGAIVGAGATAITGPGALLGGVAGGGLGFAIGDEVIDLIEDWMGYREPKPLALELQESARDIRTGVTYELVGHNLIPAARQLKRPAAWVAGKFTKAGAKETAGEVIAAMTDKGPLVAKNWDEARALEEAMPGLKFDLGQLTGEPGIIKFIQEGTETAADIAARQAERRISNTQAIQDFIQQSKEAGAGTRELRAPLTKQQRILQEAEELAQRNVEAEIAAREGLADPAATGERLRKEVIYPEEAMARKAASEKFAAVPEQDLIIDDIYDEFQKIMKPKHRTEGRDKFPKIIRDVLKDIEGGPVAKEVVDEKALKEAAEFKPRPGVAGEPGPTNRAVTIAKSGKYSPAQLRAKYDIGSKKAAKLAKEGKLDEASLFSGENQKWREAAEILEGQPQHAEAIEAVKAATGKPMMTLADLQGLRSELLEDLRTARDKGYPPSLRARLNQAIDAIDKKLSLGAEGKEMQAAQKFYREEVIEKYHKGTMKDIMRGEESVEDALVSGKFFRPGPKGQEVAKDFNRALGDNEVAKAALKDTIDQNFLNKVVSDKTGEINKGALKNWFKQHRYALKEYGLEKEYDSFVKAKLALDRAQAKNVEFNKSAASRVLGADINNIVKEAFKTGSKKDAARKLMTQVKGDKQAVKGLQNAMIDEILTEAPLGEQEIGNLLTSTRMASQLRKYDAAIREVFRNEPNKVKAMHQVRRAVKRMELTTPLPKGSDRVKGTLENMARNYGHSRKTAVSIALDMFNWLTRKVGVKDINTIVNRAILDPELAIHLRNASRGGKPEKVLKPFINRLITTGIITQPKEEEYDIEFSKAINRMLP